MAGLATLMDRNFDLRLSMFGEAALGEANLKMISLARQLGGETLNYLYNHIMIIPLFNTIAVIDATCMSVMTA